jgi:hypothetical protein
MGGVRPGRVFAGWFALVVLYTALTEGSRLSEALGIGNSALVALSDPSRPLIRDHTGSGTQNAASGKGSQTSPNPGGSPTEGTARTAAPAQPPYALGVTPPPDPIPSFLQRH